MKKIPTLFKPVFSPDHKHKTVLPEVTPGCEAVLEGRCIPTVKWDGACCAIINGEIYKRYDAKIGKDGKHKAPPAGAIPCQPEPDPITGHWPHWVKCDEGKPEDKYFLEAFICFKSEIGSDFWIEVSRRKIITFEAIGIHWQNNPYNSRYDKLVPHGTDDIDELKDIITEQLGYSRTIGAYKLLPDVMFDILEDYLRSHEIEGIVFWLDGQPLCKIKRSDFGFEWPVKSNKSKED